MKALEWVQLVREFLSLWRLRDNIRRARRDLGKYPRVIHVGITRWLNVCTPDSKTITRNDFRVVVPRLPCSHKGQYGIS